MAVVQTERMCTTTSLTARSVSHMCGQRAQFLCCWWNLHHALRVRSMYGPCPWKYTSALSSHTWPAQGCCDLIFLLAKMSENSKRRKIDNKNRKCNEKWTDKFVFILPPHTNPKPLGLICQMTIAVCKVTNIRHHHKTKHAIFSAAFLPGRTAREDYDLDFILFCNINSPFATAW